jgi:glucuronosyltransferase
VKCAKNLSERNRALANALGAEGHNITMISFSLDPEPMTNVHWIHLERGYEALYGNGSGNNNDIMLRHVQNPFSATISLYKFAYLGCIGATNSVGFQQLSNYPRTFKFDLVIYDFTCGPCLLGFHHRFGSPRLISVSAFNAPQYTTQLVGDSHKHLVTHFTLNYGYYLNFGERFMNFLVHSFDYL